MPCMHFELLEQYRLASDRAPSKLKSVTGLLIKILVYQTICPFTMPWAVKISIIIKCASSTTGQVITKYTIALLKPFISPPKRKSCTPYLNVSKDPDICTDAGPFHIKYAVALLVVWFDTSNIVARKPSTL